MRIQVRIMKTRETEKIERIITNLTDRIETKKKVAAVVEIEIETRIRRVLERVITVVLAVDRMIDRIMVLVGIEVIRANIPIQKGTIEVESMVLHVHRSKIINH